MRKEVKQGSQRDFICSQKAMLVQQCSDYLLDVHFLFQRQALNILYRVYRIKLGLTRSGDPYYLHAELSI